MSGQSQERSPVSAILVERLLAPVSVEDRERAALHVLDWVGCAAIGARSDAAKATKRALRNTDEMGTVLWTGALGNVLEMDDVDKRALLHPGPVVIPAAIAASQLADADAETFLDGIVKGYEAIIRIGRCVGADHYRYWHNTGTCGPFGAAVVAGVILGLDKEQMISALGLAGTQASGLWQVRHEPQSHAKQLHTSRAAHAGLLSAQLAKAGFIGVKTILEGSQGFFAATCGDADPYKVVSSVSDHWAIHDVSFKPWPACRHAHATIDAALSLREQGVLPSDIQKITIKTYKDAITFCDKPFPKDTVSAKFSLQHAAAVSLLYGTPSLDRFEGQVLTMPDVEALRKLCVVEEDTKYTERYPAHFGTRLVVVLNNGELLNCEAPDALGDPENPLPNALLFNKAKSLMQAAGISSTSREAMIELCLELPTQRKKLTEFLNKLFGEILS